MIKVLSLSLILSLHFTSIAHADIGVIVLYGAKDRKTSEQWLSQFKSKSKLEVSYFQPYPSLVESKSIQGLKPGLWIAIAGFCSTGGTAERNEVLKKTKIYFQKHVRGSYIRELKETAQTPSSCPVLEAGIDVQAKDSLQTLAHRGHQYSAEGLLEEADYLANYVLSADPKNKEALGLKEKLMVLQTD